MLGHGALNEFPVSSGPAPGGGAGEITGSLSAALAAPSLAASGTLDLSGALAATLAGPGLLASGSIGEGVMSAAALLWRIRQERHIARILIEPNGDNWDIDLQTPGENRPNMGWHDGAPSEVLYSISQPEGLPVRDRVYASGYVIEAATFGSASL